MLSASFVFPVRFVPLHFLHPLGLHPVLNCLQLSLSLCSVFPAHSCPSIVLSLLFTPYACPQMSQCMDMFVCSAGSPLLNYSSPLETSRGGIWRSSHATMLLMSLPRKPFGLTIASHCSESFMDNKPSTHVPMSPPQNWMLKKTTVYS